MKVTIDLLRRLAVRKPRRRGRPPSMPDIHDVARWALAEHERAERLATRYGPKPPPPPPSSYYVGLCKHLRISPKGKHAQRRVVAMLAGIVGQSTVWGWAHGRTPRMATRDEVASLVGYRHGGVE